MAFVNRGTAITGFGQQERQSFTERLIPFLLPWALSAALWPASALAYKMWGTDPAALPWAAAGLALAGAALTTVTAKVASGRPTVRAHSTGTVGAASAWCTAATIVGPGTHPLVDIWMLGGAAVALSWNIRHALKGGKESGENSGESAFFKSVKLAGTKVRGELEVAPNKVTAQLQLPSGTLTATDVASAKERIASGLSVSANSVRVTPDPEHHDRATLTVVPRDMLKFTTAWPGPSAPGGSISEPLILGVYEDGEPVRLWLPGSKADKDNPRNATHLLVMGMNGSGKSHGAKIAWTEILTRKDVCLRVIDPSKGKQTVGKFAPYLDGMAIDLEAGQTVVDGLLDEIRRRASELGELGYDQWVEGCGLDYEVVWIEEAAQLVRDSETMIDVAQQARSSGMSIVLSLQRPSFRNITTDVRAQLGAVWCFGVKEIGDAAFALDDELIDAGANPAAWKNQKPGYSYLEAPAIDTDRQAMPCRTFATTDDELVAAIAAVRAPRETSENDTTPARPATPRPAGDPFRGFLGDTDDTNPPAMPENPEPGTDQDVDPDHVLPELDPLATAFEIPQTKPNVVQARALLRSVLDELRHSGLAEVGPRDIPKTFFEHVRSRPWVSPEMARLAVIGVLRETSIEGRYTFAPVPESDAA